MLDFQAQYESIKRRFLESVAALFPYKGTNQTLVLNNVWVEDTQAAHDFAGQKDAKLRGKSWAAQVYGDFSLKDNATGKTIDHARKIKVANLPKLTPRGSYIVKGNEYQVTNQLRLKPGVYTRIKDNGELESQVNLAKGRNFKIILDPTSGTFYLNVGTSNVKLYHALMALGITEAKIAGAWGNDLAAQNKGGNYDKEIAKLYRAIFDKAAPDLATSIAAISNYFNDTKIDPETTKMTLGTAFASVTADMLLSTSARILTVSRNERAPDDRDSLEFKTIHSTDDFVAERITKSANRIKARIGFVIDKKDRIRDIIGIDTLNAPIQDFFTSTTLSNTPEQTNPLHMLGETTKVTIMGEGGIGNEHAVTAEARAVHPSSIGFLDPLHSPESGAIGTTLHLALNASKVGNSLKTALFNAKTGLKEELSPNQVFDVVVGFRDQYQDELKGGKFVTKYPLVKAIHKGEVAKVKPEQVQYIIPSPSSMFDVSTNMVPFLQNDQGNRAMMASKMMEQALPLLHRERPLVQVEDKQGSTYESKIGAGYTSKSHEDGTVTKVTEDAVFVKGKSGKTNRYPLYDHYPLNSKVYLDSAPQVKVGDKVTKGQLLDELNYTKDGHIALGTNLVTAYVPYKGYNFEDAIVVSESAAKKLTSLHMHRMSAQLDQNALLNLDKFKAYYPENISVAQSGKYDADGVIKKGEKVAYGEIVIALMRKEEKTTDDVLLSKLHKAFIKPYKNRSVTWEEDDVGTVTDVVKTGGKIEVLISTEEPAKVGDKLVGRHGNKGIIGKILSDAETPTLNDGTKIDILMNPHGIPSRVNVGQVLETVAGKIADKTGKPYVVRNFSEDNYLEKVQKDLKDAGLTDKETIFDPELNRKLPPVLVGRQYILKLDHPTRKKFSARDRDGYTADMQPGQGGGEGGQSIGTLDLYAMLAHGAKHNLREMATHKSEKNEEFWRAIQTGQSLPAPKVPFAFEKFITMVKGTGVDVKKDGNNMQLVPMTDKEVRSMSSGEIKEPKIIKGKNLQPEKDGLFDPNITGGHAGSKWSHIELSEALPNPMFENAIKTITGLTGSQYDALISGELYYSEKHGFTATHEAGSVTGGVAIKKLLDKVNVTKDLAGAVGDAKGLTGDELDKANKKIRYLKALKDNKQDPNVYITKNVPVIPPKFRPIYPLEDGNLVVSDVNALYKDLIAVNNSIKDSKAAGIPDSELKNLRKDLYQGMKGVSGLGDTLTNREYRGLIETIKGNRNKEGFFQNRIISRRQEISGRSTIIPEPQLTLDEIGIPEDMAWKIYRPFAIKELHQQGYKPLDARKELEDKSPVARKALEIAMRDRPVMANRAPTLHKFSIMSFQPKLVEGKAIRLNPLVVKGFNADFDGDTMAIHVPVTEEARKESFSMLPSNNVYNPRNNQVMHVPGQEAVLGLYMLTKGGVDTKKVFTTAEQALEEYKNGKIKPSDLVTIRGLKTTVGKLVVNAVIPQKYRNNDLILTSKALNDLLDSINKDDPKLFAEVVHKLKNLGNQTVYEQGFSVGLDDFKFDPKIKGDIFDEAAAEAKKGGNTKESIIGAYDKATTRINTALKSVFSLKQNSLYDMQDSGAKGSMGNLRQMVVAPILVKDTSDRTVAMPITKSYAEGLDMGDYWISTAGARKGMMDRALQTSEPGAFAKELMNSTVSHRITEQDCGTKRGISMSTSDKDILDRYVSETSGPITRGTLITPNILSKNPLIKSLMVRSPLTCESMHGTCATCFGLTENGQLLRTGENIGVIAGHTITEPATQMTMKTFHTGGIAGEQGGILSGFTRVKQLLEMPKIVRDKATLSTVSGKVDTIKKAPVGGWHISVGGEEHHVPASRTMKVNVGDKVIKGDSLSDGVLKPQELMELKGVFSAQRYLVDELHKEYAGQGVGVKKRLLETIVRPLTNQARILDPGDHATFSPGDYTTVSHLEKHNETAKSPIKFESVMKGINTFPLMSEDWLSRLNFQRLAGTLTEGASQGWKSDIVGGSPVAAYAYGANFGKTAELKLVDEIEFEEMEKLSGGGYKGLGARQPDEAGVREFGGDGNFNDKPGMKGRDLEASGSNLGETKKTSKGAANAGTDPKKGLKAKGHARGDTPAEEEDKSPARALFDQRDQKE